MWGIFKANGKLQVAQGFNTKKEAVARKAEIEKVLKVSGLIVKKL